MSTVIHQRIEVESGGRITLQSDELPVGATVDVVITLDDDESRRGLDALKALYSVKTGSFKTPEDVESYIRELRD